MSCLRSLATVLAIFFLFPSNSLHAAVEIGTEPLKGRLVGKEIDFHEDKAGLLTLDDVLKLPETAFVRSVRDVPNLGLSTSASWSRFTLDNTSGQDLELILEYENSPADYVDFYIREQSGGVAHFKSGDRIAPSQRQIRYRLPTVKYKFPKGQTTVFVRVQTEGAHMVPLRIWAPDIFQDKRVHESTFLAFFYGFIFVLAIYNFFLAISSRSSIYGLYVLFIVNAIFNYFGQQSLSTVFLGDAWASLFNNEILVIAANLASSTACWFTLRFLDIQRKYRLAYWALMGCITIAFLGAFIGLLSYNVGIRISIFNALYAAASILTAAIYSCYRRYRPAYFFTLAWLLTIVGNIASPLARAGVLPFNLFTEWSPFIGVAFELVFLSLALGDKIRLQQENDRQKISDLNINLEQKVIEKTRDIRAILTHIKLGIFAILPESLAIDKEYSAHMREIFKGQSFEGQNALQVLFKNSDRSHDEVKIMESSLSATFHENQVAFELNEGGLVRELRQFDQEQGDRFLELDWNPMLNHQGTVEKILVTCKDVTEIRKYQESSQNHQKEMRYITELVSISPDKFQKFHSSALQFIHENKRLAQKNTHYSDEIFKILFINIHTLKGTARSLGLKDLADLCHGAEEHLCEIKAQKSVWDREKVLADLAEIEALLMTYQEINSDKLNRKFKDDEIPVKRSFFQEDLTLLNKLEHSTDLIEIRRGVRALKSRSMLMVFGPAKDVLNEMLDILPKLAKDLKKEPPRVDLDVGNYLISYEAAELLRNSLIHLLRNAMDHGIETATERLQSGKEPAGRISLRAMESARGLQLRVSDDGRGLAIKKIEQIGIIKGLITPNHSLNHLKVANLIFESGFTTTTQLTEISGRGVGMDAVRQYLHKAGAEIELELNENRNASNSDFVPFSIQIILPRHFYYAVDGGEEMSKSA